MTDLPGQNTSPIELSYSFSVRESLFYIVLDFSCIELNLQDLFSSVPGKQKLQGNILFGKSIALASFFI